eukprot:scaffold2644_cov63-Phaeocystis_antarctica.AAC.11
MCASSAAPPRASSTPPASALVVGGSGGVGGVGVGAVGARDTRTNTSNNTEFPGWRGRRNTQLRTPLGDRGRSLHDLKNKLQLGEDLLALDPALLLGDQRRLQQRIELHEPLVHRPSAAATPPSLRARARVGRDGRATAPCSGAAPGRTLCRCMLKASSDVATRCLLLCAAQSGAVRGAGALRRAALPLSPLGREGGVASFSPRLAGRAGRLPRRGRPRQGQPRRRRTRPAAAAAGCAAWGCDLRGEACRRRGAHRWDRAHPSEAARGWAGSGCACEAGRRRARRLAQSAVPQHLGWREESAAHRAWRWSRRAARGGRPLAAAEVHLQPAR